MNNRFRLSRPLLVSLVVGALVVFNMALVNQNRQLLTRAPIDTPDLQVGDQVPSTLAGYNVLNEEYVTLNLRATGAPTLLIYFSSYCPYCQSSLEYLRQATESAPPDWRVIWISTDPLPDTRGFFGGQDVGADLVLADVPWRVYRQLALNVVPRTVIVGADGAVQRVWTGRVDDTDWLEIRDFLVASDM